MCWESFGVVIFDIGPLLQGQMRIAKLKSAYTLLIIGRTAYRKSWVGNLLFKFRTVNQLIGNHGLGIFWCGHI